MKKCTQQDPVFFSTMRGKKVLITMIKGVNKIENQGENWYKMHQKKCIKVSNGRFLWKNRPTLGQIISGTKCDRDKPIFSAEREGQ